MKPLICSIYSSSLKAGMYLYVEKSKGVKDVPEALLGMFGKPKLAMTLLLTPEKKLVNADVDKVIEQISVNGFYLQMPPQEESYMQQVNIKNSKL